MQRKWFAVLCSGVLMQADGFSFAEGPGAAAPPLASVRVLDPDPDGVIPGGAEERAAMAEAVERSARQDRAPDELKIVAWAMKVHPGSVPPRPIEQVIAVARWEEPQTWALAFLEKDLRRGQSFWREGRTDGGDTMRSFAEQAAEPQRSEVVEFVKATNFGNNEFDLEVVVLGIVQYEQEFPELLEALREGIPLDERRARWWRFVRAVGYPRP